METKIEMVARIGGLLEELAERFTLEDVEEQAFMRKALSPDGIKALDQLSVSMLHLLASIPAKSGEGTNVVAVAERAGIAKSTVSKALPLLVRLGVVERYRREGNRKEVHLRLTALGQEIHNAHRRLHEEMKGSFMEFLGQYQRADLAVVARMLDDLLRTPRQGVRFRID